MVALRPVDLGRATRAPVPFWWEWPWGGPGGGLRAEDWAWFACLPHGLSAGSPWGTCWPCSCSASPAVYQLLLLGQVCAGLWDTGLGFRRSPSPPRSEAPVCLRGLQLRLVLGLPHPRSIFLFPNVCGVHSERPHHTWRQPPSQGSSFIPAAVWGQVLGDLRGCHLAVLLLSLHPNTQCSCYQKKGKLQIDSQSALVHPWWWRFSCLGRSARARSSRVVLGAESGANSGLSIWLWFPTGHGETESWHLEEHQQHVLAVLR